MKKIEEVMEPMFVGGIAIVFSAVLPIIAISALTRVSIGQSVGLYICGIIGLVACWGVGRLTQALMGDLEW